MWAGSMRNPCRVAIILLIHLFKVHSVQTAWSSYQPGACDEVHKRETTYDDVEYLYSKFTMRFEGKLSFIGEYPSGLSACSLDPLPPIQTSLGWHPVAVNSRDFMHSLMCGTCLKIVERVRVKRYGLADAYDETKSWYASVVDKCDHCENGEIRMYSDHDGKYDVIYKAIDCPEIPGKDGLIRVRMSKCSDTRMKLQVRNTKLPTTSLELYQDGAWRCMKRTKDNFFLLSLNKNNRYDFPLKGRATAITGQMVGFTLKYINNADETDLLAQYRPFNSVNTGTAPALKCYGQGEEFVTPEDQARNGWKLQDAEYGPFTDEQLDAIHKLPNHAHVHSPGVEHLETVTSPEAKDVDAATQSVPLAESPSKSMNASNTVDSSATLMKGFLKLGKFNIKDPSKKLKEAQRSKASQSIPVHSAGPFFKNTKLKGLPEGPLELLHVAASQQPVKVDSELVKTLSQAWRNINGEDIWPHLAKPHIRKQPQLLTAKKAENFDESYCRNMPDGQYALPSDCVSFINCSRGYSNLKRCPPGLKYNAAEQVCDWPHNVSCSRSLDTVEWSPVTSKVAEQDEVYTRRYSSDTSRPAQEDVATSQDIEMKDERKLFPTHR